MRCYFCHRWAMFGAKIYRNAVTVRGERRHACELCKKRVPKKNWHH